MIIRQTQSRTRLQCQRLRFDPWVRKIPWRRAWQPTPVFLPGESQGQRSLAGCSRWSRRVGHDWATNTFTFAPSTPGAGTFFHLQSWAQTIYFIKKHSCLIKSFSCLSLGEAIPISMVLLRIWKGPSNMTLSLLGEASEDRTQLVHPADKAEPGSCNGQRTQGHGLGRSPGTWVQASSLPRWCGLAFTSLNCSHSEHGKKSGGSTILWQVHYSQGISQQAFSEWFSKKTWGTVTF